ncbi:MAG: hypothetical protein PHS56_06490 [Eubacteriales bacterium]|nr:hypothetical protein [Eubacteriales bacterium]
MQKLCRCYDFWVFDFGVKEILVACNQYVGFGPNGSPQDRPVGNIANKSLIGYINSRGRDDFKDGQG